MKIVILCGGKGTRLHEQTEYIPKPLVKIGSMPILWHIMKMYAHYGHNEFILCLGYKGEMIKDYFLNFDEIQNDFTLHLGSNKRKIEYHSKDNADEWKITFVDTGHNTNTGGRIARIKKFIGKDKEFFLTYGDGISDININNLYRYHKKKNKVVTLSGVNHLSPFGVIKPESGLVKVFEEKPQSQGFINGGFYVCSNKIFDYLKPDEDFVLETDALKNLAKKGELAVYEHNGFWHCLDTYKHYEDLNNLYTKGERPWIVW